MREEVWVIEGFGMNNREYMNSSESSTSKVAYLVKIKHGTGGTVTEDSLRVIKTPPPIMSLPGLATCAGPHVRVCCPLLLYLFIDHCSSTCVFHEDLSTGLPESMFQCHVVDYCPRMRHRSFVSCSQSTSGAGVWVDQGSCTRFHDSVTSPNFSSTQCMFGLIVIEE